VHAASKWRPSFHLLKVLLLLLLLRVMTCYMQIGNDNFLDVLSQIRGPGSPAIAEWRRLQEVMRPLAKAAVLLPPVAFR
jgi:hypothetical protein